MTTAVVSGGLKSTLPGNVARLGRAALRGLKEYGGSGWQMCHVLATYDITQEMHEMVGMIPC